MRELWYTEDRHDAHEAVVNTVDALATDQAWRRSNYMAYARLYGQPEDLMLGGTGSLWYSTDRSSRVGDNVVKSVIDSIYADVCKSQPFPLPLTSGGNWSLKRKAKNFKKYLEGLFLEADPYHDVDRAELDCLIFGTGFVQVFLNENNRVRFERVFPWEVYVDRVDAQYGRPRCMYRVKQVDRRAAKAQYPGLRADVFEDCSEPPFSLSANKSNAPAHDAIWLYEAWRLPDTEDLPGRHIICTANGVLVDEPWCHPWFPLVSLICGEPISGIWGLGVAEELSGTQMELESISSYIQISRRLFGVPRMYLTNVPDSASIPEAVMDNSLGVVVRLPPGVAKPEVDAPNVIPPETFTYRESLIGGAYSRFGVDQISSGGSLPAGVDSGIAIQRYIDKGSTRLGKFHREREQLFLDLGKISLCLCKDAHEAAKEKGEKGYAVKVGVGKYLEELDWSDIDLDDDQYTLQVFPINFLSNDPVSRLQQIESLLNMGAIDVEVAKTLLDFPDLDSKMRLDTAWWDEILWIVEEITEHGRYVPPESEMNLEKAIPMIQFARTRARLDGVPADRISMLSRWLVAAAEKMGAIEPEGGGPEAGMPPEMQPPAPMPGAPPAAPEMGAPAADPMMGGAPDLSGLLG